MDLELIKISESDGINVLSIMNHFVNTSFAAFADKELDIKFFIKLKKESITFYKLKVNEKMVGFCCLRKYNQFNTFSHTGILTYFILPEYTNIGYGSKLLTHLFNDAIQNGIKNVLACIASENKQSIEFHKKHGFIECGRFKRVGKKFNQFFDLVWMQKLLPE